ncbi:MAG: DNA-binding protein, partial [Bacteroidales bacterium]|nr:DNA-binding protein [Bacteroidales bacterium]
QYPAIHIEEKPDIHDRFLLLDDDVYHIGSSFKDLGKKLFAFSKMEMKSDVLLSNIE